MAADDFDLAGPSDKNFPQNFLPFATTPDRKVSRKWTRVTLPNRVPDPLLAAHFQDPSSRYQGRKNIHRGFWLNDSPTDEFFGNKDWVSLRVKFHDVITCLFVVPKYRTKKQPNWYLGGELGSGRKDC